MRKAKFVPFAHEDLELKNYLIEYARTLSTKEDAEAQIACAVIYASFAEYMAGHLLDNLRYLVYQTTYRDYAGILYQDERDDKKIRTMGQTINLLRAFGFPDKEDILRLLEQVSKSRNNLFHNFAKADAKGFEVLDADIARIKEDTEEIFAKVNTIYAGLQKIIIDPDQATSLTTKNDSK